MEWRGSGISARLDGFLTFDGRLSRVEFWRAWLAVQVFGLVGWALSIVATIAGGPLGALVLVPTAVLYATASAACLVRRLHDRGRSGWQLIPLLGGPLVARVAAAQLLDSHQPTLSLLGTAVSFLALVANIWALIEIGMQESASFAGAVGSARA